MERFFAEKNGASWCVRDRELFIQLGPMRGQPRIVEWFGDQGRAEQKAKQLNETRGHVSFEPHCVECGAQPAGPAGCDSPRCGACWSRL
jgi:hypothetical protein